MRSLYKPFIFGIPLLLLSLIALPTSYSVPLTFDEIAKTYEEELLPCSTSTKSELLEKYLHNNRKLTEFSKISYLLQSIRISDAEFIRNGKIYSGAQAAKFLSWKMRHPQFAASPIRTAHDFVEKVVLRSEKTGIPYEIKFPDGKKMEANQILKNELELLESSIAAMKPTESLSAEIAPPAELSDISQTQSNTASSNDTNEKSI